MNRREDRQPDLNDLGPTILRMLQEVMERQDAIRLTMHTLANAMGSLSNRIALIELRYRKLFGEEELPKKGEQSR